ncbi:MAG: hypothetical protein ACK5KR_01635 [Breznakia sp.]
MPKIAYKEKKFTSISLERIELINNIIDEYKYDGYELTFIENCKRSYKSLGNLTSEARSVKGVLNE